MVAPFQGGCRCGAIRYEVSSEPLAVMNCHCRDCQYASGGGFSTVVVIPMAAFRLTKGTPARFTVKGDSVEMTLRRKPMSSYLLVSRGFHWVNETPYFR